MAFSITQFQNNATNQLSALDNNFTTFNALVPIPCFAAGTNALHLAQSVAGVVPTLPITAYNTGMLFTAVAASTNTASTTAFVGNLQALFVYKDTSIGPQLLSGGEIVANNAFSLLYDAALDAGNGGFHLIASTAAIATPANPSVLQVNNGGTITAMFSGSASLAFTVTPGWSSNDQIFTLTGVPSQIPVIGDFVEVNPYTLGANGVSYCAMVTGTGSVSSIASTSTINIRLVNAASASLASNSGIYRWRSVRMIP